MPYFQGKTNARRTFSPKGPRAPAMEPLEPRLLLDGTPLITEFLAINNSTLADEDGAYSDWIEIYNPTETGVDLTGWHLTDNDANLTKWTFPARTLNPDEYLVVFASDKNRTDPLEELHTNFKLDGDGEYLALVAPGGEREDIVSEYDFPAQQEDISYGLYEDVLVTPLAPGQSTAYTLIPDGEAPGWTDIDFDTSGWIQGQTGVGFETTIPGFAVTLYKASGLVGNLSTAETVIDNPSQHQAVFAENVEYINYYNTGGHGRDDTGENSFPGLTIGQDTDDFVVDATATLTIPSAGEWTFVVNSSDGFSLSLEDGTDSFSIEYPDMRGPGDTLGVFNVTTPGQYDLRLIMFERAGGSEVELWAAEGDYGSWNAADFHLVGDTAGGGLAVEGDVVTGYEDSYGSLIETDVEDKMADQNASAFIRVPFNVADPNDYDTLYLRMKYDDGFVAYLNGAEIARRNAPAGTPAYSAAATGAHSKESAMHYEDINISNHLGLLQAGTNVLAIHGLNYGADDNDFLILPELAQIESIGLTPHYFITPSPGFPNLDAFVAFVGDTKFDHDRGFYDDPIDVAITSNTGDVEIFYTTDGSKPQWIDPAEYTGPISEYDGPIHIDATTTLRAMATKPGYLSTNIDTQTYIFPDDVATQTRPDGYPTSWGGEPNADYDVDQSISMSGQYHDRFIEGLTAIPSLSLVLPMEDIFGSGGLYSNPGSTTLEKLTSAELIYADGSEGFQVDAGLKMQGGASRNPGNAIKHSMSLRFRTIHGPGRLNFPLFDDWPVDEFNSLHLRAMYNNSWIHRDQGQRDRGSMIREQWMRDTLIAMGQIDAGNGTYVHLYLNGLYWGVYNVHERQESSHYAEYHGGDEDRIDALNSGLPTDGDKDSWNSLQSLVSSAAGDGYISLAEYDQIRQELDVVNLIDYMIVNHYGGNSDWDGHNWRAAGGGLDDVPWRIYDWDAERVLEGVTINKIGVSGSGRPSGLFQNLRKSDEFRLLYADRIHKHFFNDGALTPDAAADRWMARADELDLAIIGESARWGDDRPGGPYTRDNQWFAEQQRLLTSYFYDPDPLNAGNWSRSEIMIRIENGVLQGQYRNADLYPSVIAPSFNQHGGEIASGFGLAMSAPAGTIYYTTDGTDPRLVGGGTSPAAQVYGSPVTLTANTNVKARVYSGGTWSALAEAIFVLDTPADLVVTEVMYNPADPTAAEMAAGFTDGDDFEFIELQNIGAETINLAGVTFSDGVWFDFPTMTLGGGDFALVVRDRDAFEQRYGPGLSDRIAGEFEWLSGLDDTGEAIGLGTIFGDAIQQFEHKDGWFDHTDGGGYSLVVRDPLQDPLLWNSKDGWRASWACGGNPGAADPSPLNPGDIVINEVLTHQDDPVHGDWIELVNTTEDQTIDITGWYLSDDPTTPAKWQIPTIDPLGPGQYAVFTQAADFGGAFGLSEFGDEVCLTAAEGGLLRGYRTDEDFDASDRGVTFGRHIKSTGRKDFVAMGSPTMGGPNSGPVVPDVVINEIMYHPETGGLEFIELANRTGTDVPLHDAEPTPNPWAFTDGIDFTFPAGAYVPAGGYALVIGVDRPTFESACGPVPGGVNVYGSWDGALENAGERVELSRPGEPEWTDPPPGEPPGYVPYIVAEKVTYNDVPAWPTEPDGLGPSLERRVAGAYGNDVANWAASVSSGGTPGAANTAGPPQVAAVVLNPDDDRTVRGLSEIDPSALGVETVRVTFNEEVVFAAGDVTADKVEFDDEGNQTAAVEILPENMTVSATAPDEMTITFADSCQQMVDTWVRITLADAITDLDGNPLDGEPAANSSGLGYIYDAGLDLPSGDGAVGGDAVFYVGSLRGDLRGFGPEPANDPPNGTIDSWDIGGFTQKFQERDLDADFRGFGPEPENDPPNGDVDSWDIGGFTSRYSTALATGAHLGNLPTDGGGGMAAGAPSPLPPLAAEPAALTDSPEAALLAEAAEEPAPATETEAPAAALPGETVPAAAASDDDFTAGALVASGAAAAPQSPAWSPAASETAAAVSDLDGGMVDLLAVPALAVSL